MQETRATAEKLFLCQWDQCTFLLLLNCRMTEAIHVLIYNVYTIKEIRPVEFDPLYLFEEGVY